MTLLAGQYERHLASIKPDTIILNENTSTRKTCVFLLLISVVINTCIGQSKDVFFEIPQPHH